MEAWGCGAEPVASMSQSPSHLMAGQPLSPIPKAAKAEAPASPTEGALARMGDRTFWNHQPTSSSFPVTVLRMLGGGVMNLGVAFV